MALGSFATYATRRVWTGLYASRELRNFDCDLTVIKQILQYGYLQYNLQDELAPKWKKKK